MSIKEKGSRLRAPLMIDELNGILQFRDGSLYKVVRQRSGGGKILEGKYEYHLIKPARDNKHSRRKMAKRGQHL